MSTLFGILGLSDRDTTVEKVGQRAVYDAINQLLEAYQQELQAVKAVLVQEQIDYYQETYWLPGGGEMQEATPSGAMSQPGAVKPSGSWNVAYPIYHFDDAWAADAVTLAKMTIRRLDSVVQTLVVRHQNTIRKKMLRALLNKTNETFTDPQWAALTIKRLANNDSDIYPPIQGVATDTSSHAHYMATGYATASISDSNNPFTIGTGTNPTGYTSIKDQFEEHFGLGEVVVFINNAEREKIRALTAFVDRDRMNITTAITTDRLDAAGLPILPGQIIGAYDDMLVAEWRWVPAGYMLAVDLLQPPPLKERVDPEPSLQGFKLVSEFEEYPLKKSTWRDRIGYGVGNRLNGYAVQLTAAGTGISNYTTPTAYA